MKRTLLFGEPMALLIADEPGALEKCKHFTRSMSGAELNVGIGLTRLEHKVEYFTRLGDDPFGHYIFDELKRQGIGTDTIKYDNVYKTGIQLKEFVEDGRDPYAPYYRKESAAAHVSKDDIDNINLTDIELIHVTGIPPALSSTALEATVRLMERAKDNGIKLTFDPNLRPALWESQESMIYEINRLSELADVVLPGIKECQILLGTENKEKIAAYYHKQGISTVVIKDGKNGAFISERKGKNILQMMVPGYHVNHVIDTVGAGDGFAVGFLSGMLEGLSVKECAERANAIGALQVQHRGDNEGLPNRKQLAEAMHKMKREIQKGTKVL